MAEELQGLLDKIQEEGIKKADDEKGKIISSARKEADDILSSARKDADSIVKKAKDDAANSERRAKAAIQQAARDIILALKDDILKRLNKVAKLAVDEAMTPEMMAKIIEQMVKGFCGKSSEKEIKIEAIVNKKDLEKAEKIFNGQLLEDIKANPQISVGSDISGGLKIGFSDSDILFDFSDESLAGLICQFIGPKLAAMISEENKEQ
jgi:V/A-type H+-transporting ATPase subunit E